MPLVKFERAQARIYLTTCAQATYQVQHAMMAARTGTKLAWIVEGHALHVVRLLVLHDFFFESALAIV